MWLSPRKAGISILERIVLVAGCLLVGAANLAAEQPESAQPFNFEPAGAAAGAQGSMGGPPAPACEPAIMGSPFVPVDSWVYPALMRLYGMGYVDHVFLGLRPWTRESINHMLEDTSARIVDADASPLNDQAEQLYEALSHELRNEMRSVLKVTAEHGKKKAVSTGSIAVALLAKSSMRVYQKAAPLLSSQTHLIRGRARFRPYNEMIYILV